MNSPCEDCRRNCEEPCWKVEHGVLVEVVRCKDCRWAKKVEEYEPKYQCLNICRYGCTQWLDSNDFCSYGERSNNELDKR